MSIDSIVDLAARKIGGILANEAGLLYGVKGQVESLRKELTMMTSLLADMDDEGGDERIRTAIKEIRAIAYEAEDVIESFVVENSSSGNKIENSFKKYACFCCSILSTHKIGIEIKGIKDKVVEATRRRNDYLGPNGIRSDATRARVRRPASNPHHIEEHIVGLDDDINNLVKVLTTDDEEENLKKNEVVLILGMGGSGKTTLARKLFHHEDVKKHFGCVAWVSISEQWNITEILVKLLKEAGGERMRANEVSREEIEGKLGQFLDGKRYLIVLDDVWQKQALAEIRPTLPTVNAGSKIIVTTRKREVVDFPDLKCFPHEPRRLSEVESWELFNKIALIHNSTTLDNALFEELGREMLEKCEGLPLAVIALAGILGKKETIEEWEKIKKAVSARIMQDGRGTRLYGTVNEMLALSYTDLPCELKPCFLYLAVFPEDREIRTGYLVRMWIAEGFITSDDVHGGDTMEDVARGYLDELIDRCVVQIARKNYKGKVTRIRIHDLVRDLCIKKATEQDFLKIFTSDSPNSDARVTELRRTAIYSSDKGFVPFPTNSQHLRSLVYEGIYEFEDNNPNMGLQPIYQRFRLLRVLSLENIYSSNGTLPAGIGNLIHLRYLFLRSTNITQLPSSIGNLHNLLTLDYRNSFTSRDCVFKIPDVIWKLKGLRHLYLPQFFIATELSTMNIINLRLDTLKQLQTLWNIEGGNWMLKELPLLSRSIQKLSIKGISSSGQLEAAFQCPSIRFDCLHSLRLGCDSTSTSQGGEVLTLENSQAITHCQHLRRLSLKGRIEDTLSFPAGIIKLEFYDTQFEADSSLAASGKLRNLAILVLHNAYRGTKWSCCAGDFPMLKHLRSDSLDNLEEWSIERGAMPQLRFLSVRDCKRLSRISEGLKFVTTLQELYFKKMSDEFIQRYKGGEDAHIIQHVPHVQCF